MDEENKPEGEFNLSHLEAVGGLLTLGILGQGMGSHLGHSLLSLCSHMKRLTGARRDS